MRLRKSKLLNQFGALLLLLNAYFFLAGQSAIPEDEEPLVEILILDNEVVDPGIQLPDNTKPYEDLALNNPPNCGGGDLAACLNRDGNISPSLRDFLFTRRNDITDDTPPVQFTTASGQTNDPGIWKFFKVNDPQISDQNGAEFTRCEFVSAKGAASDNANLDKIIDVRPLGRAQIFELMEKESLCGVVHGSDVNRTTPASDVGGNTPPDLLGFPTAGMQGSYLGVFAFKIVGVVDHPAFIANPKDSKELPLITIELIPSNQIDKVCQRGCTPHEIRKH